MSKNLSKLSPAKLIAYRQEIKEHIRLMVKSLKDLVAANNLIEQELVLRIEEIEFELLEAEEDRINSEYHYNDVLTRIH